MIEQKHVTSIVSLLHAELQPHFVKLLDLELEFIVTGSNSLKMMGLINREPNDIDIIINCKDEQTRQKVWEVIHEWHKKSLKNNPNNYDLIYDDMCLSVIGYYNFGDPVKVDCLIWNVDDDIAGTFKIPYYSDLSSQTYYKIASPYTTLAIKKKYTRDKYESDLKTIEDSLSVVKNYVMGVTDVFGDNNTKTQHNISPKRI